MLAKAYIFKQNKSRSLPVRIYKNRLKINERSKTKTTIYETARRKLGETHQDTGVGDDFLDKIPKA